MQTEFEAKFPKIDKNKIRKKLKGIGAKCVFKERKFTRLTFDSPELRKINGWVRLRDEGDKITMAYKTKSGPKSAANLREVSFEINDIEAATVFVKQLGLEQRMYEENLREEWKKDGITYDIDTWPRIDPYLEIEASSEQAVKSAFKELGLDYLKAVFGSATEIYAVYGIDVLKLGRLVF